MGRYSTDSIHMTGAARGLRAAYRLVERKPVRVAPWLSLTQPPPLAGRAWPGERHQEDTRAGGDPPRLRGRSAWIGVERCPPAAGAAGLLPLQDQGASRPARGARRSPIRPRAMATRGPRAWPPLRRRPRTVGPLAPALPVRPFAPVPRPSGNPSRATRARRGRALDRVPPSVVTGNHGGAPECGPGVPLAHRIIMQMVIISM